LGSPAPGDPVPDWRGTKVDSAFLAGLQAPLGFAWTILNLQHDELRVLMRLYRQRRDAGAEWTQINTLMGYDPAHPPGNPRDFMGNLQAKVGTLDFAADGLPQVSSIDDLYARRTEPDVRAYIDDKLKAIDFANFVAVMQLK